MIFSMHILVLTLTWFSMAAASPTNFKIGFLPAMSDIEQSYLNEGSRYAGAIMVAMEALRNNSEYSQLNFSYIYRDTQFETKTTLRTIVEMYNDKVDVLLGPENNCVLSAELAAALNIPMIGFRCTTSALSDKAAYPTFSRTVPSNSKVTKSIIALLKHYHWSCFSIVEEETDEWNEVSAALRNEAEVNDFKINTNNTFPPKFRGFKPEHQEMICNIVKETSDRTRIHIFLGEHDAMVQYVRCLNQYADISIHTVIHVRSFDTNLDFNSPYALKQLTSFWHEGYEGYPAFTDSNILAFSQLILLQYTQDNENSLYQQFESDVRLAISQPPFSIKAPPTVEIPISIYAAKAYDGVTLYAQSVKALLELGGNPRNGQELTRMIINSTYKSIQQFNDDIDENGDAEGAYSTVAMVNDGALPSGWSVKQTGRFDKTGDIFIELKYKKVANMSWMAGMAPIDEPPCGFQGCPRTLGEVLASSIVAGVILVAAILGLAYWRHVVQKKRIDSLLWKLDKSDIEIITSRNDLDDSVTDEQETRCDEPLLMHWENEHSSTDSELCMSSLHGSTEAPWPFLDGNGDETEEEELDLPFYCPVGYFKNMIVSLKCEWNSLELTSSAKRQLHELKELSHENLNKFVGACIDPPHTFIVFQYCERGSLEDVLLANRKLFMTESVMQYSLINDLMKGMIFIHSSFIGCHGNLKSTKCLVDSRFVLRVSGFGLRHFKRTDSALISKGNSNKRYRDWLWRAPELLRADHNVVGTQKGDVYSFGIILHEILSLLGPWGDTRLSDRDIVGKVEQGDLPLTRPNLSVCKCEDFLKDCMEECWAETAEIRPDFKALQHGKLKSLRKAIGSNILENMLERIEKYSKNLEGLVEERTLQLNTEKRKTEALLHRMLPRSVAEDLKKGKQVEASYHECVTICFSDIVGFTQMCSESDPYQIVRFLNELYTRFDEIIDNYDVYKIETIGDAYMVVSGLPKPNGDNHAGEIASMALHLLRALQNFKISHRPADTLKIRMGIHSGPVAVGVVGFKMPRYCLFGDTVNTTSRMESTGLPLKVHCSRQCKEILDNLGGYDVQERGIVEMKGKGPVLTYWLTGEDSFHRIKRLAEAANGMPDSNCNSTRSSFAENLHLMPNGFRRLKLTREQLALEEFRFRPHISTPCSRRHLRRGSMPVNELKLGMIELANRRGSTPLNQRKAYEAPEGWELNEADERRSRMSSILQPIDPLQDVRAGPDGCEKDPEVDSRRSSKRDADSLRKLSKTSQIEMKVNPDGHSDMEDIV